MRINLLEAFGWAGMLAILTAYSLSSFGMLAPASLAYQLLNLGGSICLVFVSWRHRAYQLEALNVIWSAIGLISLARILIDR